MIIDLLDTTGKKFIGRPLKDLIGKQTVSKGGYRLYLSRTFPKLLGEEFSLDRLIRRNASFADYTVKSIGRYYEYISVVITEPEEDNV